MRLAGHVVCTPGVNRPQILFPPIVERADFLSVASMSSEARVVDSCQFDDDRILSSPTATSMACEFRKVALFE